MNKSKKVIRNIVLCLVLKLILSTSALCTGSDAEIEFQLIKDLKKYNPTKCNENDVLINATLPSPNGSLLLNLVWTFGVSEKQKNIINIKKILGVDDSTNLNLINLNSLSAKAVFMLVYMLAPEDYPKNLIFHVSNKANKGCPWYQYILGWMYMWGKGITKYNPLSSSYFKMAADLGVYRAYQHLRSSYSLEELKNSLLSALEGNETEQKLWCEITDANIKVLSSPNWKDNESFVTTKKLLQDLRSVYISSDVQNPLYKTIIKTINKYVTFVDDLQHNPESCLSCINTDYFTDEQCAQFTFRSKTDPTEIYTIFSEKDLKIVRQIFSSTGTSFLVEKLNELNGFYQQNNQSILDHIKQVSEIEKNLIKLIKTTTVYRDQIFIDKIHKFACIEKYKYLQEYL